MLKGYALVLAITVTSVCSQPSFVVLVDKAKVIRKTDSQFIGVTIDSGVIRRDWETFDPSSTKIQTLAKGLSPCYLRVGGTDADFLIFDPSGKRNNTLPTSSNKRTYSQKSQKWLPNNSIKPNYISKKGYQLLKDSAKIRSKFNMQRRSMELSEYLRNKDLTNFTMTGQFFDELNKFVSQVGWGLVFDLNVLLRTNGHWNSTNAVELMNYVVKKRYPIAGWELGNEPNAFYHLIKIQVEASQLAEDYTQLQNCLSRFTDFNTSIILGPSTTQLDKHSTEKYFSSFLQSGGAKVVTAASFHQYYVDGRTATVDQFYDPEELNVLIGEVDIGVNLTRGSGSKAQVWLGETSSAWGGGAEGISDRYVAGFMWLDKLGIAARQGVDVVIRQSFYGGHYALIDRDTFNPNPDYWLTLMFNTLVGRSVLNVTSPDTRGTLRIYAHCTNTDRSGYSEGSVVFYVMNIGEEEVTVTFPQFAGDFHVYHLTPLDGDLLSQTVLLNGQPLQMVDDRTLPDLRHPVKMSSPVLIPSRIFSFIVLPHADISVCK